MFDKFEIAIHLSIQCRNNDSKYHTLSDIATLVNTAAIFKNGGCECRISPNIPYLKLQYPDMYTLSQMLMFYVKLFMKYGKASFLFSMAAILNIAKNGGSINISGCFHQNSEIVWHGGHLCQISYFGPDVKMYYIKSPH